jgi:hypothetical protein
MHSTDSETRNGYSEETNMKLHKSQIQTASLLLHHDHDQVRQIDSGGQPTHNFFQA